LIKTAAESPVLAHRASSVSKKPIIFDAFVGAIIDRPKMQRYFLAYMFGRNRKYYKYPNNFTKICGRSMSAPTF